MKKERGSCFAPRQLLWLLLSSSVVVSVALATMALASKDRKVSKLAHNVALLEDKNTEFLSSILSCANGQGFSVEFNAYNSTRVKCEIEFEWVEGKYFEGLKGRKLERNFSNVFARSR